LERALSFANPWVMVCCKYCKCCFRSPKTLLRASSAVLVAAAMSVWVAFAGWQLVLWFQGYQYNVVDPSVLYDGVDPAIVCPGCGSHHVSYSLTQPLERAVAVFNPQRPYRCWDCYQRFWMPKPPLVAWATVALVVALVARLLVSCYQFVATRTVVHSWIENERQRAG